MIAPAPSVIDVAELVAQRAHAEHELGRIVGIPSRWAHCRADTLLGRLDDLDVPDDWAIRWGR